VATPIIRDLEPSRTQANVRTLKRIAAAIETYASQST
jgi:hypothetical protein